jgi:hypothetical protein
MPSESKIGYDVRLRRILRQLTITLSICGESVRRWTLSYRLEAKPRKDRAVAEAPKSMV